MIGALTGQAELLESDRCLLDVNGVGYLVHATTRTLAALPPAPAIVRLLIETQVREDAITLFGFADAAEQGWFRLLTTVQGVGARVALGILSAMTPADLARAIQAGDRGGLTRAPGVGPKLAARLLTELRDKVAAMPVGGAGAPTADRVVGGMEDDALSALVNLGYRRPEAQAALARVQAKADGGLSLDMLIREGLKELAR